MLVAWTDGHCAPHPGGRATWAFIVKDGSAEDAARVHRGSGTAAGAGAGSSALAEWRAAFEALAWLAEHAVAHGARDVVVRTDHNGVWKTLSGRAAVPVGPRRRKLAQECRRLTNALGDAGVGVRFERVPRHENAEADALARDAWARAGGTRGEETGAERVGLPPSRKRRGSE